MHDSLLAPVTLRWPRGFLTANACKGRPWENRNLLLCVDGQCHVSVSMIENQTGGAHQMYTKLRMSFWKQEPPKPTLAFRNLGPMRESVPVPQHSDGEM